MTQQAKQVTVVGKTDKLSKPIVIVCAQGDGYHSRADCPILWERFNKWFAEGLAMRREEAK